MRPTAAALCLLSALVGPLAGTVEAQDITVQDDEYVLQFDETDGELISDFVDLGQKLLGRPIRYNPADMDANARIFILGPQRVKQAQFFQYFQSVLKAYDFIVVEYGPEGSSFLSIQKISAGGGPPRTAGGGTFIKSQAPVVDYRDLDDYRHDPATLITTSLPLRYIDGRSALSAFSVYFESAIEGIRNVENTTALLVTGFGSHVWGVWQLLQLIDVPPHKETPVIHKRVLQHASVDEIQSVLTELLSAARGLRAGAQQGGQQQTGAAIYEIEPRIIPEPRSNSLLISGDEEMVARVEEWIDALDVEVEPLGNTHVYRLRNSDATEVSDVLTRVFEQERLGAQNRSAGGQGGAPGQSSLEIQPSAVPDRASNAVIITAGDRKYAEIVNIIREMDVRRPQVLIECAIVETSKTLSESLAVGIAAVGSDVALVSNFGTPTGLDDAGAVDLFGELSPPSLGGSLALVSGGNVPIPLILQALETDTGNRVLSRPYLMTNDNEEATLTTQEQTSFQTSVTTQTATTNSFEEVEAGITLVISPTISAGNYLRLRVRVEVSNFAPASSGIDGAPPDKVIREVETPITLPDGHTVILGGLVSNDVREVRRKTPWLGDLWLIGWFFRSSSDDVRERYLYIFITPHIIDTDFALLDEISSNRKRDVERLGGDIRDLTADPAYAGTSPDVRLIGPDVLGVFDMPTVAFPSTGEMGPAPMPVPVGTSPVPPLPTPETTPGFDEVFGYGGSGDG